MVSTPLKNISQNGNLPQIGVKIKNIWNYHPGGSIVLSHQWCEAGMSFKICHSEVWISEPNTTKLSPFCTSFLHFWLSQIGSTRLFRSYPKTKCHRNLTNLIVKSRKLAASLLAQNPTSSLFHTFSTRPGTTLICFVLAMLCAWRFVACGMLAASSKSMGKTVSPGKAENNVEPKNPTRKLQHTRLRGIGKHRNEQDCGVCVCVIFVFD